jgi:hypothetical protein
MSFSNCFSNDTTNLTGSDYIARKRAINIFKGATQVAKGGGKLVKKKPVCVNGVITMKPTGSVYDGGIYTTKNCNKLIGANSYELLNSIIYGKYLADPISFSINRNSELWVGNLLSQDLSGLITIDASFGGISNSFYYPPDVNSSTFYPIANHNIEYGGIYVDPCYNVFYGDTVDDDNNINNRFFINKRVCSTNNYNHVKFINLSKAERLRFGSRAFQFSNALIGKLYIKASNLSLQCDKKWLLDLSSGRAIF